MATLPLPPLLRSRRIQRILGHLRRREEAEPPHGNKDEYRMAFMLVYRLAAGLPGADVDSVVREFMASRYARKIIIAKQQRAERMAEWYAPAADELPPKKPAASVRPEHLSFDFAARVRRRG